MDPIEDAGPEDAGTSFDRIGDGLAGAPKGVACAVDLGSRRGAASARARRLASGVPEHVPAGFRARQTFAAPVRQVRVVRRDGSAALGRRLGLAVVTAGFEGTVAQS